MPLVSAENRVQVDRGHSHACKQQLEGASEMLGQMLGFTVIARL
jgi:hypothetical protein